MSNKTSLVLIAVIVILCGQNFFLSKNNQKLKRENSQLSFLLYTPADAIQKNSLRVLPHLALTNTKTGDTSNLSDMFKEKERTIVLIFSTDCFACAKTSEKFNEVYDEFSGKYNIIGISKDAQMAIEEFSTKNNTKFPLYRYEKIPGYDMFGTLPMTVGMDTNGQVLFSFTGIPENLKNQITR